MGSNPHKIQCNTNTSCKYVILEMKKRMKLANDAYFSIYDVQTSDLWWDQTSRVILDGTDKLIDITSNWKGLPHGSEHVLLFRRRKLYILYLILCLNK
jgi:hypothetical protein